METWLLVLIGILVVIAIIACVYMIFAFRRISIVSKKLDYLIEDITYKSEKMNNVVDAVVKLSSYVDVIEGVLKRNSQSISTFLKNNSTNIDKYNVTFTEQPSKPRKKKTNEDK